MEDLKKGMHDLYVFLSEFEYVEKISQIKSKLYTEAIKYVKQTKQDSQQTEQEEALEIDHEVEYQSEGKLKEE